MTAAFDGRPRVLVLGGGVGGLSAAQELAERDVPVTVVEGRDRFGGKARSMPGPDRGDGPALPGEHGFRFFPGFYRHLPDTMSRIPYGDNTEGVADNLVAASQMLQGLADGGTVTTSVEVPDSVAEWRESLEGLFGGGLVPADESTYFVNRMLYLLTACEERRNDELEGTTWWEFINAEVMSEDYQKLLGYGLTQMLVAMRPEVSSARTIGRIYLQMFRGLFDPSIHADRLLNGPSNEVWIDPWTAHLRSLGVDLRPNTRVTHIHADGRAVTGVEVDGPNGTEELRADEYVAALPVDVMESLVTTELARTAPSLSTLDRLDTGWMNGIQFYLAEDVPTVRGHGAYYDSPWALTSISQRQFWSEYDVERCGTGDVSGVLSVIISEWDEPGIVYEKPARECSPEELKTEVWEQLKLHLNHDGNVLVDNNLVDWFLDPSLSYVNGKQENAEPLLVNTVDTLRYRPEAVTEAANLTVASDYVRTNTDLASMEAANEAARRAVNGILDRAGIRSETVSVWNLEEPSVFDPAKRADAVRYRLGVPHPGDASPQLWRAYRSVSDGLTAIFGPR
jgi:uncharacterized protein with NAD-binding domain and iron-sulfur cluster